MGGGDRDRGRKKTRERGECKKIKLEVKKTSRREKMAGRSTYYGLILLSSIFTYAPTIYKRNISNYRDVLYMEAALKGDPLTRY